MPRVIVGLGNPGSSYQNTRHNLGFLAVEAFAQQQGLSFKQEKKFEALVAKGNFEGQDIFLVLPQTYMNLSGRSVSAVMRYYKVPTQEVLIVVDDIALAFNKMRLRLQGSAGGHNGLKSIRSSLGTGNFTRLRLGIGDVDSKGLTNHVLGNFSKQEQDSLDPFIDKAVSALKTWICEQDPKEAMNQVNGQENAPDKACKLVTQKNNQVKD
jgi:peptidyl-tRNA hydrolase, PTH1 family